MDSQLLDISTTEAAMPNNEKLNDASALLASVYKGIHNKTTKYGLPTY